MTAKDDLDELRRIARERQETTNKLDALERATVKRLREEGWQGTRWDVIANALGISRQAVMKRHADALAESGDYHHRRRWDAGQPRRS